MAITQGWRKPTTASQPLLTAPRFEVVPLPGAAEAVSLLPPSAKVTVTSSPSQGFAATIDLTVELAQKGYQAVPHLAAREIRDEDELVSIVERLSRAGVQDVFVVGGDAPHATGRFNDGLSLLTAMAQLGRPFADVGVPSYPEGHHAIADGALWQALEAKQRFATYTVTQLCFDADTISKFSLRARYRGIGLPIVAGIPGAVDPGRLLRVSMRVGVGGSIKFVRGHRAVVRRLLRPSGYRPDGLIRGLERRRRDGDADLAGLHVYTFNQVESTVNWLDRDRAAKSGARNERSDKRDQLTRAAKSGGLV
jgi:methylenetetrahydrofolate reductase (NADPH)